MENRKKERVGNNVQGEPDLTHITFFKNFFPRLTSGFTNRPASGCGVWMWRVGGRESAGVLFFQSAISYI